MLDVILVTSNLPFVRVPVLSVNNIFILPAVSIPIIFLTITLFFNILFILDDNTNVIIIGKPSGTATTIIVTESVKAFNIYLNIILIFVTVLIIRSILKLLSIIIFEKRYENDTKIAPIYPILLIMVAKCLNLIFNGLSGCFS